MVASARTVHLNEETEAVLADLARRRGIEEGVADADAKRFVSADDVKASVRDALKR